MKESIIKNATKAALVADSYSLGAHWIYDPQELKDLEIDWNELSEPKAVWHEGKQKGDFTHYGDQAKWLEQYVDDNDKFDINSYKSLWLENMKTFKGYLDGSCKETLKILKDDSMAVVCSSSHDISIVGSISPLLSISESKEEFLANVKTLVAFTHNDPTVLSVAKLFSSVLFDVANGGTIDDALTKVQADESIKDRFESGLSSKSKNTFESIKNFGASCSVEGAFEGTVHLLAKFNNYKEAMITNAKCGGDSAARAMIVGMIMGAAGYELPSSWVKDTNYL